MREVAIQFEGFSSYNDFLRNGRITVGNEIEMSKGVILRYEGTRLCESVDAPSITQLTLFISIDVMLPIALGLVSSWIYDKIKDEKTCTVRINGIEAKVDKQKISELLAMELQEKPDFKEHTLNLALAAIDEGELLMSARTLSGKPISFDGKRLPYPDNMVSFADYKQNHTIETIVYIRDDVLNAFFDRELQLFAIANRDEAFGEKSFLRVFIFVLE